jgi:arginase
MDVVVVEVPYMAGDDRHGVRDGPRRLVEAGAESVLREGGVGVTVETVDRDGPFRDTASSSAVVNRRVARMVGDAVDGGRLPLVLAGSCAVAPGVLAGFSHARTGVVWIDAHADFNTPESTTSGFFPGMSLALLTGHCYRSYWTAIGDSTPVAEEAVVIIGARDISPEAERERLEGSAIHTIEWQNSRPAGDVEPALDALAGHADDVYLHVDLDAFDPQVAPGIVDEPVPGGLSIEDARDAIRAAAARLPVRAATIATFDPERDRGNRTVGTALELIRLVGEIAAGRPS